MSQPEPASTCASPSVSRKNERTSSAAGLKTMAWTPLIIEDLLPRYDSRRSAPLSPELGAPRCGTRGSSRAIEDPGTSD